MIRRCFDCGQTFEARGAWQRRCWDCWRAHKDGELRDAGYARGYADGLRAGRASSSAAPIAPSSAGELPPELLRELVSLCHPDRHPPERFEAANRATAELLALLRDVRAA